MEYYAAQAEMFEDSEALKQTLDYEFRVSVLGGMFRDGTRRFYAGVDTIARTRLSRRNAVSTR